MINSHPLYQLSYEIFGAGWTRTTEPRGEEIYSLQSLPLDDGTMTLL